MLASQKSVETKSKLTRVARFFFQLIVATLIAFTVASALHTQAILSDLVAIGAEIPSSLLVQTMFVDFVGLLPSYGSIVFVGMIIAMTTTLLLIKKLIKPQMAELKVRHNTFFSAEVMLYALAGGVAMFTILAAMQPIMHITIIAGARGTSGLLMQTFAGVVGGAIFGLLRARRA